MAEIQKRTHTTFVLIRGHYLGLVLTGTFNRIGERCLITGEQGRNIVLQPDEKRLVPDQTIFNDLGDTGMQLPLIQRVQHAGIGNNTLWLIEGTDHVFAQGVIDTGLATHR